MPSWDDFRIVKAIADCGSLAEAAKTLRINQSTVFRKLGQIEHRIGARLFKRNRSGYTLTPRGEEMVRLADRMEQDVAAFERGLSAKTPMEKSFVTGVVPMDQIMARSGLEFLTDMIEGKLPQAPMCATLGFHLAEASDGYARFDGVPEFRHYNPIGTVHGGFAATLLDSALGCAIFTTLAKGEAWTTLELKLNLVRPINKDTGTVRAEGRIIHRGRTVATAEGTVKDKAGKLYAHATTTCMVFPAKG
jgi:molybdate transport repressor ModE-like protein